MIPYSSGYDRKYDFPIDEVCKVVNDCGMDYRCMPNGDDHGSRVSRFTVTFDDTKKTYVWDIGVQYLAIKFLGLRQAVENMVCITAPEMSEFLRSKLLGQEILDPKPKISLSKKSRKIKRKKA